MPGRLPRSGSTTPRLAPPSQPEPVSQDDKTPVPASMPQAAQPRSMQSAPDPRSSPATSPGQSPTAAAIAAAIDPEEINRLVREEVQKAVRDQMLTMVKTVLGDLFQERMMPRLLKYGEDRINTIVASDLQVIMQNAVEAELAKLGHE